MALPITPTIFSAYPLAQDCDVAVLARNVEEARLDLAAANVLADEAFERFQLACERGDADADELRQMAEVKQDFADAAKLDYQQAVFCYRNMWN